MTFLIGTHSLIIAATGYMTIESIKAGDLVWATDPETGATELKQVTQLFRNETNEWIHVTVNGEEKNCYLLQDIRLHMVTKKSKCK